MICLLKTVRSSTDCRRLPAEVTSQLEAVRLQRWGNIRGSASKVIDATGLTVAAGFMDIHTHYDAALSGGAAGIRMPRCLAGMASRRWRSGTVDLASLQSAGKTATGPCDVWNGPSLFHCRVCKLVCDGIGRPSPNLWIAWRRGGLGVNAASLVSYSLPRAYV